MRTGSRIPTAATAPVAEPDSRLGILSVSPIREDHVALRQFLSAASCRLTIAGTCHTALRRLKHDHISIVVCECSLPDGTWRNILTQIQTCPERPFLIVTSGLADDKLWAEVLNLGGFDIIAKPFDPHDARHVLETACLRRGSDISRRHAAAAHKC